MSDNNTQTQDTDNTQPTVSIDEFNREKAKAQRTFGELTNLQKELEKYKGIDPTEFFALKEAVAMAEKEKATKDPKLTADYYEREKNKAISTATAEFEAKYGKLQADHQKLQSDFQRNAINRQIVNEFNDQLIPGAVEDLENLLTKHAKFEDGQVVFVDADNNVIYKAGKPMTSKDFINSLKETKSHWFKSTSVQGSQGITTGEKSKPFVGTVPRTMAELNALPNPHAVLKSLTPEQRLVILNNTKI
jgi:hypothetical protein